MPGVTVLPDPARLPGVGVVATGNEELPCCTTIGLKWFGLLMLKKKSRSTPISSRKFLWIVRKRVSMLTWIAAASRSLSSRLTTRVWFSGDAVTINWPDRYFSEPNFPPLSIQLSGSTVLLMTPVISCTSSSVLATLAGAAVAETPLPALSYLAALLLE